MQKIDVHSTDASGGNIIPGREDGNNDLGNGSTYQIYRNNAATNSGSQQYFAKDKDGNTEPIGPVGGAGIGGGGTLDYIAKFTPDGTHIGNSLLFDNGTSIGFGTAAPAANATFDIHSTTQGILLPRMTLGQKNAIAAPTDGLLIYETTTHAFAYWDATLAAWIYIDSQAVSGVTGSGTTNFITKWTNGAGSVIGNSIVFDDGTNVGIGINPATSKLQVNGAIKAGVASTTNGSLIYQNSTNANTVSINSGVTSASYSLTLPTAQGGVNTFLENDGAGNLSWGTVVLTNFYQNGGNAFGGNATIGLTDNFNWSFLTNNTVRGLIDNNGLWAIGSSFSTAGTQLTITSTGTTNATFIEQLFNATPTLMFSVRDDGYISAGIANGSMTIGLSSAFNNTLTNNTYAGVLNGNAGERNTAFGNEILISNTANDNTGVGYRALNANTSGTDLTAVGRSALLANTTANNNTAVGVMALSTQTTGGLGAGDNTAVGVNAFLSTNSYQGVAIGFEAGKLTTGERNSIVGWRALGSGAGSSAYNSVIGWQSMELTTTAQECVAIGYNALHTQTTGGAGTGQNTALGSQAGFTTNGYRNLFLGKEAGYFSNDNDQFYIHNSRINIASEADGKALSLMYGQFGGTTSAQFLRHNSNVGILTNTFGTNANGVLAIANGTAPTTTSASASQIFSANVAGAGTASLGLFLEQAVVTESVVSDRTLLVTINGTLYKICLKS